MKFSLVHPSRGRAEQAFKTLQNWIAKSSNKIEIEHILSVDNSDVQSQKYAVLFTESKRTINDNTCVVEATNHAAKLATGDILIYLSDDFDCPENWDELILKELEFQSAKGCWLLKVDDLLQAFHVDVLTIPIMSRELYLKLGYFWHKEYKSMFVDQHLFHTCKNNDWLLFAPNLKFPHLHYSNGKAPLDKTYEESSANWNSGKALYHKHKSLNFPL